MHTLRALYLTSRARSRDIQTDRARARVRADLRRIADNAGGATGCGIRHGGLAQERGRRMMIDAGDDVIMRDRWNARLRRDMRGYVTNPRAARQHARTDGNARVTAGARHARRRNARARAIRGHGTRARRTKDRFVYARHVFSRCGYAIFTITEYTHATPACGRHTRHARAHTRGSRSAGIPRRAKRYDNADAPERYTRHAARARYHAQCTYARARG